MGEEAEDGRCMMLELCHNLAAIIRGRRLYEWSHKPVHTDSENKTYISTFLTWSNAALHAISLTRQQCSSLICCLACCDHNDLVSGGTSFRLVKVQRDDMDQETRHAEWSVHESVIIEDPLEGSAILGMRCRPQVVQPPPWIGIHNSHLVHDTNWSR